MPPPRITTSGFIDPMESRNYLGSSGYWMGAQSGTAGDGGRGGYRPGQGYPGSAATALLDLAAGKQPSFPYQNLGSRYSPTGTTPATGGSGFTPLVVEKFPGLGYNDAVSKLSADLSKAGGGIPNFSQTLAAVASANNDVSGAFDRYQGSLNIEDYAATQRGFDPAYAGLTAGYADTARGIGSRYGQSVDDYTGAGGDVLDKNLANAAAFRDTEIPASINDALATVGKNLKLYDFANPGGYNSAIPAIGGREAVRATLPFRLEANRNYGNALMARLPFLGDVASRNANLAGFNLGNETNIYGQQQGDLMRRQQTEDKIQNLKLQTAGLSLEASLRKVPELAAAAEALARVNNLPLDNILKRAQTVEGLLRLMQQANYTGVEQNGGANVVEPQYFSNQGIPSRYGPTLGTRTGNTLGSRYETPETSSRARNPVEKAYFKATGKWPDEDPNRNQSLLQQLNQRYLTGGFRAGVPYDPNNVSGGGGFSVSGGDVTGIGSFGPGMDWNAAYARGRTPGEQDYFDAISRNYE